EQCQNQDHDQYSSEHVSRLLSYRKIYLRMQPLAGLHAVNARLQRDADRNPNGRVPTVVQVIAVVDVSDINVVGVVPVIRPIFWPRINKTEPIAAVLEAGISAHNLERPSVNSEPMIRPKVSTEPVIRDAVAVVTTTLLP